MGPRRPRDLPRGKVPHGCVVSGGMLQVVSLPSGVSSLGAASRCLLPVDPLAVIFPNRCINSAVAAPIQRCPCLLPADGRRTASRCAAGSRIEAPWNGNNAGWRSMSAIGIDFWPPPTRIASNRNVQARVPNRQQTVAVGILTRLDSAQDLPRNHRPDHLPGGLGH